MRKITRRFLFWFLIYKFEDDVLDLFNDLIYCESLRL